MKDIRVVMAFLYIAALSVVPTINASQEGGIVGTVRLEVLKDSALRLKSADGKEVLIAHKPTRRAAEQVDLVLSSKSEFQNQLVGDVSVTALGGKHTKHSTLRTWLLNASDLKLLYGTKTSLLNISSDRKNDGVDVLLVAGELPSADEMALLRDQLAPKLLLLLETSIDTGREAQWRDKFGVENVKRLKTARLGILPDALPSSMQLRYFDKLN